MKEIFRDIPDYDGLYQITNLGRVYSVCRKDNLNRKQGCRFLKQQLNSNSGYLFCVLSKNSKVKPFDIHVLMAITFLGHVRNGIGSIDVDHIDNNKLNNKLSNLQLITHRENMSKDRKNGSSKYTGVWKEKGKFRARILINGKYKGLGSYKNEIEAHNSYQKAKNELKSN